MSKRELFERHASNPILTADDWPYPANAVFKPGSQASYERVGDVGNAVFPCGLIHDEATGELRMYYGAADTSIALATAQLEELVDAVLTAPV